MLGIKKNAIAGPALAKLGWVGGPSMVGGNYCVKPTRGVWGHAPPGKVLKLSPRKCYLEAY